MLTSILYEEFISTGKNIHRHYRSKHKLIYSLISHKEVEHKWLLKIIFNVIIFITYLIKYLHTHL